MNNQNQGVLTTQGEYAFTVYTFRLLAQLGANPNTLPQEVLAGLERAGKIVASADASEEAMMPMTPMEEADFLDKAALLAYATHKTYAVINDIPFTKTFEQYTAQLPMGGDWMHYPVVAFIASLSAAASVLKGMEDGPDDVSQKKTKQTRRR